MEYQVATFSWSGAVNIVCGCIFVYLFCMLLLVSVLNKYRVLTFFSVFGGLHLLCRVLYEGDTPKVLLINTGTKLLPVGILIGSLVSKCRRGSPKGSTESAPTYSYLILAGLCFALFGDSFMAMPMDENDVFFFHLGALCFALQHVLYTVAFCLDNSEFRAIYFVGLLGLAVSSFSLNWKFLPFEALVPVTFYTAAISCMVWRALVQGGEGSGGACLDLVASKAGAISFAISDSIVINEVFNFAGMESALPFASERATRTFLVLCTMSTYYMAQYLIARGAGVDAGTGTEKTKPQNQKVVKQPIAKLGRALHPNVKRKRKDE
uniref:YhhN-like protein n=1 Tax=Chromera velia CCMP2878 TaxID=1169474 RepID=A0A0G4F056_9ALVE|mmetsp:Transcript_34813/g.68735  ORF Transcript_34813/g.68735 Transcript_34813/m.68735 type:complete len:322 (+) Transcript_34813:534-1499(+)|eukprot:Cvel_14305.t1-p1 / transcript=Cvel_14305.t1 / gene=Cvel_14305 / organism=Chromera_velia_CCMP2878 / gene_product=Lysoplasmalogenase, putative / transcript_product=Lysoplasmalogenase, putative / location=Cvel_scaffold1011:21597-24106(-) / protein_length=321 / sequence_SO=supercontig / SO=protein_coding / is_pseudo=false